MLRQCRAARGDDGTGAARWDGGGGESGCGIGPAVGGGEDGRAAGPLRIRGVEVGGRIVRGPYGALSVGLVARQLSVDPDAIGQGGLRADTEIKMAAAGPRGRRRVAPGWPAGREGRRGVSLGWGVRGVRRHGARQVRQAVVGLELLAVEQTGHE